VHALASLVFAVAGLGIQVGTDRILPVGYAPAWSPNGERIAFVTRGDLWVATQTEATPHSSSTTPHARVGSDGTQARVRTRRLRLDGESDGLDERRLARGAHPAWSPSGERSALGPRGARSHAPCGRR
jgi:Tol biopolymer transport system component